MKNKITGMFSNKQELKYFLNKYKMIIVLIVMVIAMSIVSPYFMTSNNIINIIRQISINAVLALGVTFVIILGGIDLSVGSILAVSSVVTAGMLKINGASIPVAIIIGVLIGAFLGLINGLTIAKFKVPPFVVTLAMMTIARGTAYVYSKGRPIVSLDKKFLVIGQGDLVGIPYPIIIMVVLAILTAVFLNFTKFGRHVYAVGGNEEAARVSGINVFKVKTLVYTIAGLFAGIGGVILTSRINSGQPQAGLSYELDAIAAVVIGGSSLTGGVGTIQGTLIGALIIGVINNGLNLLNVSQYYQLIVKGFVIALAVIIDVQSQKKE